MAKIQSSEIIQKAIKDLRLDAGRERIPSEASDKIVLTYLLNKERADIAKRGVRNTTGTSTVYSTPANKDFYVTSAFLGLVKDATCDAATGRIELTATINGESTAILCIPTLTLTAQSENLSIAFPYPIKIDRGTNITHALTFAAGAASFVGGVSGFELEK